MTGDKELVIKVVVDSTGAVKNLQELDQSVQGIARSSESSSAAATKLGADFGKIALAAGAAGAAILAMAERGSAVNDVSDAFNALSKQAGVLGDTFLNDLVNATDKTISNFELQKSAIEAVRAGAKPDEFVALTEAARALAEQTGGSTTDELNQLSQAFETGRVMGLKNKLGIIDLKKAEDDLAKSLGISADKLNKEGQIQAARIAILEASRRKTAEVGQITRDAGDAVSRMRVGIENLTNSFLAGLTKNENFNRGLNRLADIIANIDFTAIIDGIDNLLNRFVNGVQKIKNFSASLKEAFINALPETSTGASDLIAKQLEKYKKAAEDVAKSNKALVNPVQQAEKAIKNEGKTVKDTNRSFVDHVEVAKAAADAQEKLKKQFQDNFETTQKAWEEIRKLNSPSGLVGLANNLYDNYSAAVASGKSNKELQQIIDEQVQSWIKDGVALDNVATAMQNFGKEVQGVKEKATGLGAIFQGLFGLDTSTANLAAEWTQLLVGALGQAFDNLSVAFGSGGTQFSRLQAGLAGVGAIIGTAIGAYFGAGSPQAAAAGGAIGAEIGNLAAQIGEGVHNLFDNETAGTKAKKEADKFFAGLFDANRLKIVIDGQLQDLQDLVFSGDTLFGGTVGFGDAASGFFDFFDSLSSAAHQSFASLGLAFAALLGDVENLGGTLGAVFANNLGDLNNLQVAIQATGVSAQQLEQAITEAFLNGEISALEAQTAFIEIQNIMSQGIPDAVGAVTTAFDNLKAAGAKGGRYAVDALKDIGAEAKELNLKTLPELFQYLVNSGKYSAEEIKKLQDALAQYGITSLDQLSNLSNETAIAILAALQAANFPFAETSDQIKEIEDGLNKIPKDTHRNIIFDVKLNASAQDRDILNRSKIQIPVTPNGIIAG